MEHGGVEIYGQVRSYGASFAHAHKPPVILRGVANDSRYQRFNFAIGKLDNVNNGVQQGKTGLSSKFCGCQ
jgi:hypothetical protein